MYLHSVILLYSCTCTLVLLQCIDIFSSTCAQPAHDFVGIEGYINSRSKLKSDAKWQCVLLCKALTNAWLSYTATPVICIPSLTLPQSQRKLHKALVR